MVPQSVPDRVILENNESIGIKANCHVQNSVVLSTVRPRPLGHPAKHFQNRIYTLGKQPKITKTM